ncbi:hypothetical protein H4S07_006841, partial [Coemansia furcata]
ISLSNGNNKRQKEPEDFYFAPSAHQRPIQLDQWSSYDQGGTWRDYTKGAYGQGDARTLVAIDNSVPTDERYGAILEIAEGKVVVFQGIIDVCVLSGAVSICEYSIVAGSAWKRVYSPSSHPLVSVRSIRTTSSATGLCDDGEISQLRALWEEASTKAAGASGSPGQSRAVVAFRSVSCGLEHIGVAAPPYRNLFALKHFSERQEMGLPKKPAKRKLALSRL